MRLRLVLLLPLVLGSGCFGSSDADLSGLEIALVAASSIGHSASITAAGMDGATACVSLSQACGATYPCDGTAALQLGNACPLPLGGVGSGRVAVSGSWSAHDDATLALMYGVDVSEGHVAVSQAVGVSVRGMNGHFNVAYAGQNVTVTEGATLAAQSSWTVDVDQKGSAVDPSDDLYTIHGAQQGAGASATGQVTLTGVILDPACRNNPVAGMAVVQQVGGGTLVEQDLVTFHSQCDGKVDVKGTLGGTHAQALVLFH